MWPLLLSFLVTLTYSQCYRGVNLAGLEFGSAVPGILGKDYVQPTNAEVDYFMSKGMNTFRIPFMWERMQRSPNATFDGAYFNLVQNVVNYATGRGAYVVLDPHNYARYYGKIIGSEVPVSTFTQFWGVLATRFKGNSKVIFGLMNEPNTMSTEVWLADANAAITTIRNVGARNLILVPGNAWTGAHSWFQNWYGTPNSQKMNQLRDPQNNYAIEIHQYLDSDSSGSHANCVSGTIGAERLSGFTTWARQNKLKAWLGEWAGGRNSLCYTAISSTASHISSNRDVYIGWAWWAAGPWWGDYMYALDPVNGQDRPQMQYLKPHLC